MVQRKSPDKLGVQADPKSHHVHKSENRPTTTTRTTTLKPSMSQTPELKKLMKKSRSIKRSEFDYLRSNSTKRGAGAKSKSIDVTPEKPQSMVTPHKTLQVKIPEDSPPNYMKSTSSSIARKERLQVTPQSSKTRKDLDHKPGRNLTKTPSLRPVRTLTKAGRGSTKKNSGVDLYKDQNVGRDTCSSTLKDSKFPSYVALHPGGTESEGTSVMKVCPYTYCSLNGHHHAQLPPLKCFLSARRRSLKTQKSMRMKSLSSGTRKPSVKPNKVFEEDPAGSAVSSLINEEDFDFFVEIYAQSSEDTSISTERNTEKDGESFPDDSLHSATSFEDNIDHDIDFLMEDMDKDDGDEESDSGESEIDGSMFDISGTDCEEGEVVDINLNEDEQLNFKEEQIVRSCYEQVPANEEYLNEEFDGVDQAVEIGLSGGITLDLQDSLPSDEDEEYECIPHVNHETQSEVDCSEPDCSEPEENVNAEDEVKEAEGTKDKLEQKESNICISSISTEINGTEEINLKHVEDISNGSATSEIEDDSGAEKTRIVSTRCIPAQEHPINGGNTYKPNRCKRPTEEYEEPREFNPRGPRFLPLEPEVDPETVDLRHQMMDERKNSEEWMLDYALRRAVTELTPARKRKVALLVEAFEAVTPVVPKYEIHLPHTPTGFTHTMFMQACS